jgi:hypothetical protein
MTPNHYEIGVGATAELSLRVSVATLVKVLFKNPSDGELMLALERKATLHETENAHVIKIKSQPFGGAIHILDLKPIHDLIGDFHFDSEHSRTEQDFRLLIRPSAWSLLREFCLQHIHRDDDPILETDPERELAEEFADALKINLQREQYVCKPVATLVENEAAPTENIHAIGNPTVRIYRIFEASITDYSLAHSIMKNGQSLSHQGLQEQAWEDFQNSGEGRANAALALPLERLTHYYLGVSPHERNTPVVFEQNQLDETVPAVLEDVRVPKYQKM